MSSQYNGFVIELHFSVGSVLSRTFSTLRHQPVLFFGLAAMATLPSTLINFTGFGALSMPVIYFFVNLTLGLMVQGAIAYGVFLSLAGDDPSWGEVLSRGFRRVFYLFLIAVIIWILSVFLIFVSIMLVIMTSIISILAFLTMFFMAVVMICLICSWAVTIQACVVEQLGPIASINRSARLTKGYRWHLFALFLIVLLGFAAFTVVGTMILSLALPRYMLLAPQVKVAVMFMTGLFGTAFLGVMCSVIYYDLRAAKEGLTIDSLADIFD